MEKQDRCVSEEVFRTAVDKARGIAEKMKKLFKSPLHQIDALVISKYIPFYRLFRHSTIFLSFGRIGSASFLRFTGEYAQK
jgi:hypothetical protein